MSGFERVGSGGLTCRFTSDPQANQITQVPPPPSRASMPLS